MSVAVDIADAVTASLNAAAFSQPLTAERIFQPTYDLTDLSSMKVSVVPKAVTFAAASRDGQYVDVAVDVGIQRRVADDAEMEAVIDLADEIIDHLMMRRLADYPDAAWLLIEHDPVAVPDHLEQHRVLTSIVTVTYRVRRMA